MKLLSRGKYICYRTQHYAEQNCRSYRTKSDYIAAVETVDNGKAVRETLAADIPLAIDHFRYFASVIRAEEGSHNELDKDTVSLIVNEPLGVIAQIIPWNFPILMAVWKQLRHWLQETV